MHTNPAEFPTTLTYRVLALIALNDRILFFASLAYLLLVPALKSFCLIGQYRIELDTFQAVIFEQPQLALVIGLEKLTLVFQFFQFCLLFTNLLVLSFQ